MALINLFRSMSGLKSYTNKKLFKIGFYNNRLTVNRFSDIDLRTQSLIFIAMIVL